MLVAFPSLLAPQGVGGRPVLATGVPRLPLSLQRAQVNTRATFQDADGIAWSEANANQARTHGNPARLLVEGQRTNVIRNPRCEGAAAGTPGTMPTFWSLGGTQGLSTAVIGSGSESGIGYVDIRFFGMPSATGTVQVNHDSAAAASDGQTWAYSLFSRLVAGSLAGVGNAVLVLTAGTASSSTSYTLNTAPLGTTRRTTLVTAAGGATSALGRWRLAVTAGVAVDITVRLGGAQTEQGHAASSPILPVTGSPAASTRGADLVTAALAALGIGSNGRSTIGLSGVLPALSGVAGQTLLQVDAVDDNNRFTIANPAGSAILRLQRFTAGVAASADAGSLSAGAPFRIGLSIDGSGRAAVSLNGGAAAVVTGGPASALSLLRLGNNAAGLAPLFGEVRHLQVLPFALMDASLPGFTAALPG